VDGLLTAVTTLAGVILSRQRSAMKNDDIDGQWSMEMISEDPADWSLEMEAAIEDADASIAKRGGTASGVTRAFLAAALRLKRMVAAHQQAYDTEREGICRLLPLFAVDPARALQRLIGNSSLLQVERHFEHYRIRALCGELATAARKAVDGMYEESHRGPIKAADSDLETDVRLETADATAQEQWNHAQALYDRLCLRASRLTRAMRRSRLLDKVQTIDPQPECASWSGVTGPGDFAERLEGIVEGGMQSWLDTELQRLRSVSEKLDSGMLRTHGCVMGADVLQMQAQHR
jgi:hypothetical protein